MSTIADPDSNKVRLDEHQARFPNYGIPWTKPEPLLANSGRICPEVFVGKAFKGCLENHGACQA
jgi:hypothetical protein